jgi:hypothetical protein
MGHWQALILKVAELLAENTQDIGLSEPELIW